MPGAHRLVVDDGFGIHDVSDSLGSGSKMQGGGSAQLLVAFHFSTRSRDSMEMSEIESMNNTWSLKLEGSATNAVWPTITNIFFVRRSLLVQTIGMGCEGRATYIDS